MGAEAAAETAPGKVTGLPIPRYVSLKTDRVNLREGPSKEHRTAWVFQRAGLPVRLSLAQPLLERLKVPSLRRRTAISRRCLVKGV